MNIFVKNSYIRTIVAVFICISFFLYLVNAICINHISIYNRSVVQERELERNFTERSVRRLTNTHSEIIDGDLLLKDATSIDFNEYHDDNKLLAIIGLVVVAFFFGSHLFLMLLFLIRVKNWLVETNRLIHKIPSVIYVHRKDGKKKIHPSYGQICY